MYLNNVLFIFLGDGMGAYMAYKVSTLVCIGTCYNSSGVNSVMLSTLPDSLEQSLVFKYLECKPLLI